MRGVYSFVLVFAFIVCLLVLLQSSAAVRSELADGTITAMEIERASFLRFQLEENVDAIIEQTLDIEGLAGNLDDFTLNELICTKLQTYFLLAGAEKGLGGEIGFFLVDTHALDKQFTPSPGKLEPVFALKGYTKTVTYRVKGKTVKADFYFTGGVMKNKAIIARIRVGKTEQYMLVLPGYTVERGLLS